MKNKVLSIVLAALMLLGTLSVSAADYPIWENPRAVNESGYEIPYMEEGNPFVTHYAPWLRNFHLLSDYDVENGVLGGEACQMVHGVEISPVDSDIMYFGTNTSGIYRTTNRGKHWYNVTNNAAGHDIWGLLCDPIDKNTVYVTFRKTGTHRSRDGGKTWEQLVANGDQTPGRILSNNLAYDKNGNIYIASGNGIYKLDRTTDKIENLFTDDPITGHITSLSGNSGATWSDIKVDGTTIYATGTSRGTFRGGLYVSEDGGATWEIRGEENTYVNEVRTIALHPEVKGRMFAGMNRVNSATGEESGFGLYKSEDYGNTWTRIFEYQATKKSFYGMKFGPKEDTDGDKTPDTYPLYICINQTNYPLRVSYNEGVSFSQLYTVNDKLGYGSARQGFSSGHGWLYQAFAVDYSQPGRVIFPCTGIYEYDKFDDEGNVKENKFTRISAGFSGVSVMDIAFDSSGKMFLNAIDSGSWLTDSGIYDGENYPTFNQNVDDYFIHSIFDPNDDNHIISFMGHANGHGKYSGIRQSYDGGVTFEPMNEDAKLFTVEPEETDESLGETEEGEEDEDTSSDTTTENYDWATLGNAQVLCYDNTDKDVIYSSYHTSYDNGKSWQKNDYFVAAVSRKNTKRQIGIEANGTSAINLYLTDDAGQTWKKVMSLPVTNVNDMKFDENDANYVWYTAKRDFAKISLSAKSIDSQKDKFDYDSFTEFEINPNNPNHMLVASSPGSIPASMKNDFKVAESIDGGKTWNPVPGFWGSSINRFIFSENTDEVFVGTMAGLFIYDYNKFNYYASLALTYGDNVIYQTVPRINASGENVNNGKYVVAPSDVFYPYAKKLIGWEYNGDVYEPGDWFEIAE